MVPLKRCVVKEEFVALTGNAIKALVLNQLEYWQKRTGDTDRYLDEINKKQKLHGFEVTENYHTHGWIYKTAKELSAETMIDYSEKQMLSILKELCDNGWLLRRNNPNFKWDHTYQYRLDLYKIQSDLEELGYNLQNWNIEPEEKSNRQEKKSVQEEESSPLNGTEVRTIPETTNIDYKTDNSAEIFNEFRKVYPGSKRGNDTELNDFKKKHKDWKDVVPKLLPSLKQQIELKESKKRQNQFVPEWKNLRTWLYQRCWEEEVAPCSKPQKQSFYEDF